MIQSFAADPGWLENAPSKLPVNDVRKVTGESDPLPDPSEAAPPRNTGAGNPPAASLLTLAVPQSKLIHVAFAIVLALGVIYIASKV
jgi:hypothetical protein